MKLSELKQFISGAIRFKETEKGIVPCRFTTEQMKIYENHELRLLRANTCTGVKMSFVTDEKTLFGFSSLDWIFE